MTTPAEPLCVRCQKRPLRHDDGLCGPCFARQFKETRPPEPSSGFDGRRWEDALLDAYGLPRKTEITYRYGYGDEFEEEWAGCLAEFLLVPFHKRWQDRPLTTFREADGTRYLVLAYRVWYPGEPTYRVRFPEDSPTALALIRTFAPTIKTPGPENGKHLRSEWTRFEDKRQAWIKTHGRRPTVVDLAKALGWDRSTLTRKMKRWRDMGLPVDDL